MLKGKQTWHFHNKPIIVSTGVTGGPFEKNGKLAADFDVLYDDLWMQEDTYEKAHRLLVEKAVEKALEKGGITEQDVQFFLAGDLINQITPTSFAARTSGIPYFGLFGACSTSMEGLALSSLIINSGAAKYVLTGASSHNAAVEKQFRYPTEYGGQKPPTAQWTITGAGMALLASGENHPEPQLRVTHATIGRVIDKGLKDPFNMGGAMAPAAADTILAHFQDLSLPADHYDLVITGDLATIGRETAHDLLKKEGLTLHKDKFRDCGLMIYNEDQEVQAGGSGAGCSATVLYGHIFNQMKQGKYKRILAIATGALLSPLSFQQKDSIPTIAHAVAIEFGTNQEQELS